MTTPLDMPTTRARRACAHPRPQRRIERRIDIELARQLMDHRVDNATAHARYSRPYRAKALLELDEPVAFDAFVVTEVAGHQTIHVICSNATLHVFGCNGEYVTMFFPSPRRLGAYGITDARLLSRARAHEQAGLT